MPLPVTPLRHRAQMFGAIFLSVGSVFLVSRLLKAGHHGHCHGHHGAPAVTYVTPIPLPTAPPAAAPTSDDTSSGAALKRAVSSGDVVAVKRLLESSNVHAGEYDNDAPLILADTHPEIVKLLLDHGVNEPDLSTACIAGATNAVTRILAKGASPNPTDGTTPLYDALETTIPTPETRYAIVTQLLAAGANPNGESGQPAPLTAAVSSCESDGSDHCLKMIRLLQSKGAKTDGVTLGNALIVDPTVLDHLLAHPLEPGATAVALSSGNAIDASIVKKIAARGVVWSWHDGETDAAAPLIDAVDLHDVDMVRAMLDAGAPPDLQLKDGRCALSQAIDMYAVNPSEAGRMVELLLARGASANKRFPDGRSPLFAAAETGEIRLVNALLNAGARVNDKVLDETPLDAAERSGHTAAARVLDAHGGRRAVRTEE